MRPGWNARSSSPADTALVEGADHCYNGREDGVATAIYYWPGRLP